jgi:hypothetical protein
MTGRRSNSSSHLASAAALSSSVRPSSTNSSGSSPNSSPNSWGRRATPSRWRLAGPTADAGLERARARTVRSRRDAARRSRRQLRRPDRRHLEGGVNLAGNRFSVSSLHSTGMLAEAPSARAVPKPWPPRSWPSADPGSRVGRWRPWSVAVRETGRSLARAGSCRSDRTDHSRARWALARTRLSCPSARTSDIRQACIRMYCASGPADGALLGASELARVNLSRRHDGYAAFS